MKELIYVAVLALVFISITYVWDEANGVRNKLIRDGNGNSDATQACEQIIKTAKWLLGIIIAIVVLVRPF